MPSLNTGFLCSHSERLRFSSEWSHPYLGGECKQRQFDILRENCSLSDFIGTASILWHSLYLPLPCVHVCVCGLDRRNHQIDSLQFIRIKLLKAMEIFSDYLWADGNKRKTSQGFLCYFPFLFTSQLQNMAIDFSSQQETKDFISRLWL